MVRRHADGLPASIDSREADAVHVVMNATMAAMPLAALAFWSGLALWLLAGTLLISILIGVTQTMRNGSGQSIGASVYHLISVAAMIYAMSLTHHGAPAPNISMHQHGAMDHTAMGMDSATSGSNWIAVVLGMMFLLDGLLTLGAGLFAPQLVSRATAGVVGPSRILAAELPAFSRRAYFTAAFAHVSMDLGMAWMLLN
ncbi:MAG: DUF5134 domain-containing protein [Sphingobium sp.]